MYYKFNIKFDFQFNPIMILIPDLINNQISFNTIHFDK